MRTCGDCWAGLLIEAGGGEAEVAEEKFLLRLLPSFSGETAKSDMI
jgi:hypothetical protein